MQDKQSHWSIPWSEAPSFSTILVPVGDTLLPALFLFCLTNVTPRSPEIARGILPQRDERLGSTEPSFRVLKFATLGTRNVPKDASLIRHAFP
jgi:hypothetical protein